ncbi:MAG: DUF1292 domain-containing protein [Clostridia bacterium]|nr:DUF1292 domain-containing protein [Clostridia bacterium]
MADEKNPKTEELDEEVDFITLQFEGGEELECEVLGIFPVEDKEYIALMPDDQSGDIYLYGYKEDDDNDEEFDLIDIEDDEEFEKVKAEFERYQVD